jgi:hypothetical protein
VIKDADPVVLNATGSAGVLADYASAFIAFLDEADLILDEHSIVIGQMLDDTSAQVIMDGISIRRRATEQVL